jgi:antitoxin component YwqK of YwqJK toxin-antitoxin module
MGLFDFFKRKKEVSRYNNGNVESVCHYIGELQDGEFKSFDDKGNIYIHGYYKKGLEYGVWKQYYENGQLENDEQRENGERHGKSLWYTEDGVLVQDSYFKDGLYHGLTRIFHENGQLNYEGIYENDREKDGLWKYYYDSGKLKYEASYLNGKLEGEIKTYDEKGNLLSTEVAKEGVIELGNYIDKAKDGVWEYYHDKGIFERKIKSEGSYKKGLKIGIWKEYDFFKNIRKEESFNSEGIIEWGKEYNSKDVIHKIYLTKSKIIYLHQTDSKGVLMNQFEEGYGIPFFEGVEKEVEQSAQRHILYEIELPVGFDEEGDDPHNEIDMECIIDICYIEGYLEVTEPEKCFILGIDEDDHANIVADYAYAFNGYGEDDSGVSQAKKADEAITLFRDYINKYAKGRKDKYISENKNHDNDFNFGELIDGLFTKDEKGFLEYLKERPNMARIFEELTKHIRNGFSVKQYLDEANIMKDDETRRLVLTGFIDIKGFIEIIIEQKEDAEKIKDLNALNEAIKIIQNDILK